MNMNDNRYMGAVAQGHVQAPRVNMAAPMIQREHLSVMTQSYLNVSQPEQGKKLKSNRKNDMVVAKAHQPAPQGVYQFFKTGINELVNGGTLF